MAARGVSRGMEPLRVAHHVDDCAWLPRQAVAAGFSARAWAHSNERSNPGALTQVALDQLRRCHPPVLLRRRAEACRRSVESRPTGRPLQPGAPERPAALRGQRGIGALRRATALCWLWSAGRRVRSRSPELLERAAADRDPSDLTSRIGPIASGASIDSLARGRE